MTQTPREVAEAKIAALQWASKALRSLGTWDAVKAIDERIVALALPAAPSEPTAFEWTEVETVDEMQVFFRSRLAAIRETAKEHGYAIAMHGSERRDFDLVAIPWVDNYSSHDILARAINKAACGLEETEYRWKEKPNGRVAVSIPICWPGDGMSHDQLSLGCIDLSVTPPEPTAEGREALEAVIEDEQASHLDTLRQLTTARADVARMKAAMEDCGDALDYYTLHDDDGTRAFVALKAIDKALKGTSP